MQSLGKLCFVSLGAGASDLVTIKALRTLQSSDAICVPTKSADGSFNKSITHRIVTDLFKEFGFIKPLIPIYSPMKLKKEDWDKQVATINNALEQNAKVCFVTLGDAGIYSTVYYLLGLFAQKIQDECEIIPGVTSFSYASSIAKKPLCLGENSLEILPLSGKNLAKTKVYMRPSKNMPTDAIIDSGEMMHFEELGNSKESFGAGKPKIIEKYMTLLIDFNGKNTD